MWEYFRFNQIMLSFILFPLMRVYLASIPFRIINKGWKSICSAFTPLIRRFFRIQCFNHRWRLHIFWMSTLKVLDHTSYQRSDNLRVNRLFAGISLQASPVHNSDRSPVDPNCTYLCNAFSHLFHCKIGLSSCSITKLGTVIILFKLTE